MPVATWEVYKSSSVTIKNFPERNQVVVTGVSTTKLRFVHLSSFFIDFETFILGCINFSFEYLISKKFFQFFKVKIDHRKFSKQMHASTESFFKIFNQFFKLFTSNYIR